MSEAGGRPASGRVSVIIPTRNRAALLAEALGSLRAQTYTDWEALVVDDGSTDDTLARLQAWAAEDPRVRPVPRAGPPGGNACRNAGLGAARGEYVVFLDDDDMLSPGCLAGRLAALAAHPALAFGVFAHEHFVHRPGDLGRVVPVVPGRDDLERYLRMDVPWQTTGPLWRRAALATLGPWDEALPCWQDWDFHVRALARGLPYHCFPEGPRFFHRVPSPQHADTIGARRRGPVELAGVERCLASAQRELERAGALSPRRCGLLAQLHLSVAEQLRAQGHAEAARGVWGGAWERGLVDAVAFGQGRLLLAFWSARPVRGVVRRSLQRRWVR